MQAKQPAARAQQAKNRAAQMRFSRNLRQGLTQEIASACQRRAAATTAVEKRICTIQIHAMRLAVQSLRQNAKLPTG